MTTQPRTRTLAHAVSDVRYGYHYGELNERFWQHLDTLLNVAGALGGSAAVASVFAQSDAMTTGAGVAMALASVLQLVLRPSARAVEFRDARRQFADLDARAWSMQLVDVDAELIKLQATAPVGLRWLGMPAFNAAMRADGHADALQPLGLMERIALAMS